MILFRSICRNVVDGFMVSVLVAVFRVFDADLFVKVVVFWGEGGIFCSGVDFKVINGDGMFN